MANNRKEKGFFLMDTLWACTLLSLGSLLFCGHWAVLAMLLDRQQLVEQAGSTAMAWLYHKEAVVDPVPGLTVESSVEPMAIAGVVLRKVTVYGPGKNELCTFARFEKT